jgi:death-on-curing protein
MPNPSLVDSAISRPYNGYYRPIARKTAALVQSVATNHGFTDGNKRTALILMHTLLIKSAYQLVPSEIDQSMDDAAEKMVMAVVKGELDFEALVKWFKDRLAAVE